MSQKLDRAARLAACMAQEAQAGSELDIADGHMKKSKNGILKEHTNRVNE